MITPLAEPESPSAQAAEADESSAHPPTSQDALQPLPAIDFLLGDFNRRFERQSWRIRHEEERRRLKQKFEVSSHAGVKDAIIVINMRFLPERIGGCFCEVRLLNLSQF